ncbi:hypothetical protein C5468_08105 [Photorhabdus luminescens subsp. mexicana]|uniref:Uncharacterized protein n=1 Tax=Photorhabdus luminescens subsp. mexicana TaxID=2100167 RepID=A0A4R4JH02_PHOLU|nr:hypothetical protein C5468_08105 [Photorhabdus luminescens subsp. mexicana]
MRAGKDKREPLQLIIENKNLNRLQTCLETAHNFNISEKKAKEIFNRKISIIRDNWHNIFEEA